MQESTPKQTFTANDRLCDKKQFDAVFADARKLHHSALLFLFRANSVGYPRLGLAVSKRVLSKASKRNYLKRCVRESFRRQKHLLQGVDIIVLPKKELKGVQPAEWYSLCAQGWQRLIDSFESR